MGGIELALDVLINADFESGSESYGEEFRESIEFYLREDIGFSFDDSIEGRGVDVVEFAHGVIVQSQYHGHIDFLYLGLFLGLADALFLLLVETS